MNLPCLVGSLLILSAASPISAQPGALDPSFNPGGSGPNGSIARMVLLPSGQIVVAGPFTSFNGISRSYAARLNSTGALDNGFVPSPGSIPNWWGTSHNPGALAVQSDGKVIVGIDDNILQTDGPEPACMVYRYNTDGGLDPGFTLGTRTGYQWSVWALHQDAGTGKILVGGNILGYNGDDIGHIVRLQSNGVLEWQFAPGPEYHLNTRCIAMQPDGKILIAGYGSGNGMGVQRLNTDGTTDASFVGGTINNNTDGIYVMQRLSDGRILIGGCFSTYGGIARNGIAMLHADGSLDTSFDPGAGVNGCVRALAVQTDGKILIGGAFTMYNGTPRNGVARLNADGSLDAGFNPGTGANGTVNAIALRPDGQVLIAGDFTTYNGSAANRIALLSPPAGPFSAGVRVFLEGPFAGGGLMTDALRTLPSFPLTEPFTAMGYSGTGYPSGASISTSVLAVSGNNAIVDWMVMELRSSAAPGTVVAARPALLQRDGDVVDLNGTSNVSFPGLAGGSYCIALRPRNHLPVMSSPSAPITGNGSGTVIDFTSASTALWDNDARTTILGMLVLAAGDINSNGNVQYTGSGNDRDPVLVRVGSTTPNATVSGYWREDLNLDGVVKYTGSFNDRDRILVNVGATTPNNVRAATLP